MADDGRLELDGSAGGGQLVRTALALSVLTDQPVRLSNVRGARPDPGLSAQHLAAVRAVETACNATVSGAEVGSGELTFRPGSLDGGRIEIDIGTAGSVTLLFDALLPVALRLDEPLAVTATGGTDVKWSPTMAYYRRVKLPLLRRWGVFAALDCRRSGFYPVGGGEATLWLAPSSPPPLELTERGSLVGARVYSKSSADLADSDVAQRQATSVTERLRDAEIPVQEVTTSAVESASPGSSLAVALDYDETTAGFDALGERGKPAEEVGEEAAEAALAFATNADGFGAVDAHMADQLVVFLALSGGRVAIPEVTDHVRTVVELAGQFGFSVTLEATDPPTLVARR